MVEQTSPGRLQNRLLVLQERATEAIKALPVACREDWEYGMVETRVWGLEALKHVLRMRLALQSTLMLCRPVDHEPEIPPSVELLAANLTLNIHNKGNRCFANAVLRMWCWMDIPILRTSGAHPQSCACRFYSRMTFRTSSGPQSSSLSLQG